MRPSALAGRVIGLVAFLVVVLAAFFGLAGAHREVISPVHVVDGRPRWRTPFTGLATLSPPAGTVALVLVVLGSTAFDGITRTRQWLELISVYDTWPATAISTLGLIWAIAVVTMLYVGAVALAAALTRQATADLISAFAHSLVPIALAYGIAHYFSLLIFEGQAGLSRLSDPFGHGWDLFGTAGWTVNFLLISPAAIAWVQAASIVVGHVAGVALAHDRALALLARREATRSQYQLLGAMVGFTVGGLALLLGG